MQLATQPFHGRPVVVAGLPLFLRSIYGESSVREREGGREGDDEKSTIDAAASCGISGIAITMTSDTTSTITAAAATKMQAKMRGKLARARTRTDMTSTNDCIRVVVRGACVEGLACFHLHCRLQ